MTNKKAEVRDQVFACMGVLIVEKRRSIACNHVTWFLCKAAHWQERSLYVITR